MPLPLTVYADAEDVAIGYLEPNLPDVDEGDPFTINIRNGAGHHIRVRRVGGPAATPGHDNPMLDVLVWHDTDKLRMAAAQELWGHLRAANGDVVADKGVITFESTFLGPQRLPDPADDTKEIVMFTVSLLVRPLGPAEA